MLGGNPPRRERGCHDARLGSPCLGCAVHCRGGGWRAGPAWTQQDLQASLNAVPRLRRSLHATSPAPPREGDTAEHSRAERVPTPVTPPGVVQTPCRP